MDGHGRYRVLGETVDDAAGEAFDKVARFLGLGYPGRSRDRPARARGRSRGDPRSRGPMRGDGLDFSFSGLKTAVVQYVRKHPDADVADVAASFQAAIVDVLVDKLLAAARETGIDTIVAGGGVAANSALRERLLDVGGRGRRAGRAAEHRAVHRQRGDGRGGGRLPPGRRRPDPARRPRWSPNLRLV